MNKGLIKNLIGLVFIPILISITKSFYSEFMGIEVLTETSKYFLFGLITYIFLYIVFFKMEYLYVAGHEFVHALCVWFCGGRVLSFNVGKKRGSVTATKSNIFIDLMPYLIPIYTILISLIYFITSSFWQIQSLLGYFLFLIGFSISFHIVMTVDKMKIEQPDFLKLGYLNSLSAIYFVNVIIIGLFFSLLFPDFSFADFLDSFLVNTRELYINIFEQLFQT